MNDSQTSQSDLTTSLGNEGLSQQSWWVEQWMELINTYRYKKRLERAWKYAREGNVLSIKFESQGVYAKVQGTEKEPYLVKLWLDMLNDEDWKFVLEEIAKQAKWSAQLLAGIMPKDIEKAFAASGKRLFPFNLEEINSQCSCPDKANPCKHISAIYFLMGDRFEEDPFILFQLRGRDKNTIISNLKKERKEIQAHKTTQIKQPKNHSIENNLSQSSFSNNDYWWSYDYSLDPDLVIITPEIDSQTGINMAGEIPLATDPKFPDSKSQFISNLISHSQKEAQKAMIKAMQTNT